MKQKNIAAQIEDANDDDWDEDLPQPQPFDSLLDQVAQPSGQQ
jgi:hypothetical protein